MKASAQLPLTLMAPGVHPMTPLTSFWPSHFWVQCVICSSPLSLQLVLGFSALLTNEGRFSGKPINNLHKQSIFKCDKQQEKCSVTNCFLANLRHTCASSWHSVSAIISSYVIWEKRAAYLCKRRLFSQAGTSAAQRQTDKKRPVI